MLCSGRRFFRTRPGRARSKNWSQSGVRAVRSEHEPDRAPLARYWGETVVPETCPQWERRGDDGARRCRWRHRRPRREDGLPCGVPIADNEASGRSSLAKFAALVEAGYNMRRMSVLAIINGGFLAWRRTAMGRKQTDYCVCFRPTADGQRRRPIFHVAALPDLSNRSLVGAVVSRADNPSTGMIGCRTCFIYAAPTRSKSSASKGLHLLDRTGFPSRSRSMASQRMLRAQWVYDAANA